MRESGNVEMDDGSATAPISTRQSLRSHWWAFAIGAVGIVAIVAGLLAFLSAGPAGFDNLVTRGDIRRVLGALGSTAGLLSITGVVALIVIGLMSSYGDFVRFWTNVQLAFESGTFYFFAGLALLVFARHGSDASEHPTITFILAMLGVAIMLFGTGSQATGALAAWGAKLPANPPAGAKGQVPSAGDPEPAAGVAPATDWGPMKANAVVAGGAAVLTAIFGFGVIQYSDRIPTVFNNYGQYARVTIRPCLGNVAGRPCNEDDLSAFAKLKAASLLLYRIDAENADGKDVYVIRNERTMQILALQDDLRSGHYVTLHLKLIDTSGGGEIPLIQEETVQIPLAITANGKKLADLGGGVCEAGNAQARNCRLTHLGGDKSDDYRTDMVTLDTFALNFAERNHIGNAQDVASRSTPDDKDAQRSVTIQ